MSNTRLRRCAQVIAARRSAGVVWSVSAAAWPLAPLPRLALVSCARCALFGANTPWKRVRLMRGLGTSAASVRHLCFELPFRLLPELVHRLFQLMQALRDGRLRDQQLADGLGLHVGLDSLGTRLKCEEARLSRIDL